jgi:hypothetical protein
MKDHPMTFAEFETQFAKLYDSISPFEKGDEDKIARRYANRLEMHWEICKGYPLEVYRRGVRHFLRNNTDRDFPRPAHIIEAIKDSYQPPTHVAPRETPEEKADREKAHEAFLAEFEAAVSGSDRSMFHVERMENLHDRLESDDSDDA